MSRPAREAAPGRSGDGRDRLLLVVVASAIFLTAFNQTFVNVVVPDIQRDYGATGGQVGWVLTGYLLVLAVGVPLYGRFGDLFGLRRVFALGLLVLAMGSLVCALSQTLPVLVVGRILQAVGAGAIPALGFAAVAKNLPAGKRGTALGFLSSSVGVGAATGPVVGGLVAGLAGWHALFYLTMLLAVLLVPGALRLLPGNNDEVREKWGGFRETLRRFDLPGGLSLALSAGLALFGVTQGQAVGFSSTGSFVSLVAAALLAGYFFRRIRTTTEPFVEPALFRNRVFVAAAAAGFLVMLTYVGTLFLVPLMLSEIDGLSAAGIGLVLAPGSLVVAFVAPFAGRLSDGFGAWIVVRTGLAAIGLSTFAISAFATGASPVAAALCVGVLGAGFAMVQSPSINAAVSALPGRYSGAGLGIYQMLFVLGGGFGPAVAAVLLASRRNGGTGAINPLFGAGSGPYSDALLMLTLAMVAALLITLLTVSSASKGGTV